MAATKPKTASTSSDTLGSTSISIHSSELPQSDDGSSSDSRSNSDRYVTRNRIAFFFIGKYLFQHEN